MRKLFAVVFVGFLAVSCSSSKVDEIKNTVAEKAERAVVKELKEAYSGVQIVDHSCDEEAEMIGEKVYDKVADILKVESRNKKSAVSMLVPLVCETVVGYLPELVADDGSKYACLRSIAGVKLEKVGKDLCSAIDL